MSIQRFTDALRNSIATKNYYAALALAITLPDVCGRITAGRASKAQYVAWIKSYLPADYWRLGEGASLFGRPWPRTTPEDFYALRCAYLHEGTDDITDQRVRQALDQFRFVVSKGGITSHQNPTVIGPAGNRFVLPLDVTEFCREICAGVEAWSRDVAGDSAAQARLSSLLKIYFADDPALWR